MGLRFRKSFKIAPGVRFNVGKKSHGISIGGRGGGISFNSKSGTHARVSIPGTGISYTTKVGGKKRKKSSKKESSSYKNNTAYSTVRKKATVQTIPVPQFYQVVAPTILPYNTLYAYKILFLIGGIVSIIAGIITIASFGIALIGCGLYFLYKYTDYKKKVDYYDEYSSGLINSIPSSVPIGTMVNPKQNEKIINDCIHLITTTKTPSVFFERYALMELKLDELIAIGGAGCTQSPYPVKDKFVAEKQQYVHDMIQRCFTDAYEKANSLKTDNGKLNRYDNFVSSFKPYFDLMSEHNVILVNTLYNNLVSRYDTGKVVEMRRKF